MANFILLEFGLVSSLVRFVRRAQIRIRFSLNLSLPLLVGHSIFAQQIRSELLKRTQVATNACALYTIRDNPHI